MKHKLGACLCEECKAELREKIEELDYNGSFTSAWYHGRNALIRELLCEEASV